MNPDDNIQTNERLDGLLEGMRPRMAAARKRYVQRTLGTVAIVPALVLGVGAATVSLGASEPVSIEVAGPAADDALDFGSATPVDEPDAEPVPVDDEAVDDENDDKVEETEPIEGSVSLGFAGEVSVKYENETMVLGEVVTNAGWEASVFAEEGQAIVVVLEHESGVQLVAIVTVNDEGELVVELQTPEPQPEPELEPEPTPAPKPKPEPEPEPKKDEPKVDQPKEEEPKIDEPKEEAPEVENRKEIDVNGYGGVVVERVEGNVLAIGIQWTAEGWASEIVTPTGELVKAKFFNDQYIKTIKVWATENGHFEWKIHVEELDPPAEEGTYDGVVNTEFGSYGVVVENGTATIVWVEPAEGYEYSIYQESGDWVKVNFSNEAQGWWVKAWGHEGAVVHEAYAA